MNNLIYIILEIHVYGTFVFRPSTKANIRRWGLLAILRQPFAYFHTRDQLSLQQKKKSNIFISKHLKGQLGPPVHPLLENNFYRAWRSPKKVLMQKSQKFCADFKYVNLKIELLQIFEKKSFSSLFLMRKPLSSDQKWFLRPYFPLIGGIFVLKSGLRFLFRALEVSIQKVRKSHFLSF